MTQKKPTEPNFFRRSSSKILGTFSFFVVIFIFLWSSSCSRSETPSSTDLPSQTESQIDDPIQPAQRIPQPGVIPYPPHSFSALNFSEVWDQYTEDETSWFVLAGPGLLVIDGTHILAFESSESLGREGMPKGLSIASEDFLWEQQLPRPPKAPPLMISDALIWALPGFGLIAIDRVSGSILWHQELPGVYSTLQVYQAGTSYSQELEQSRKTLDSVLIVSDRYQGLVFVNTQDGSKISGPYPEIRGEVLILEDSGFLVVTDTLSMRDASEDQFILSTLFPFSQGPLVKIYSITENPLLDAEELVLKPQLLGSALGSVIHPSGQGLLMVSLLGSRRIEVRHLERFTHELRDQNAESDIQSRVLWTSEFTLGIDQAIRVQGSIDPRVGVWPLILVSQDRYIDVFHGGLGVRLESLGVEDLRNELNDPWKRKDEISVASTGADMRLGTVFVPGVRADRLIGLRIVEFPGLTNQITPLFLRDSGLGLLTSWGMFGSQPEDGVLGAFADLLSPLFPDFFLNRDQEILGDYLPDTFHFLDPAKTNFSNILWNVGESEGIQLAFPAQLTPLRIKLRDQKPGVFFYQTRNSETSPLLVQVYHQDDMVYTNASHVSLDSQGRFELSGSQEYEIHITWALGDEGMSYGIGSFLIDQEP